MTKLMREQCEARSPDWRGPRKQRFRWRRLRWEWGLYCYIVHPVEDGRDIVWWEWDEGDEP